MNTRRDPKGRRGSQITLVGIACIGVSFWTAGVRDGITFLGIHFGLWFLGGLILCGWGWTLIEDAEEEVKQRAQRYQRSLSSNYSAYLQSPEWKGRRNEALARADYRCQLCNSSRLLEVHHRTYKDVGDERPEDLIVLCDRCHEKFHEEIGMPDRD